MQLSSPVTPAGSRDLGSRITVFRVYGFHVPLWPNTFASCSHASAECYPRLGPGPWGLGPIGFVEFRVQGFRGLILVLLVLPSIQPSDVWGSSCCIALVRDL